MSKRSRAKIEQQAEALLDELGACRLPIDVERIARELGYEIVFQLFEGDISGTVIKNGDSTLTIGINTFHSPVRQRFSIAHEIGHARLHLSSLAKQPFVDPPARVLFRDGTASLGEAPAEIEANQFAAALLMPARLVLEAGQKLIDKQPNVSVDELVRSLAGRAEVSTQAMRYRLVTFGVLEPE